jgi:hypothetical protein
MRRERPCIHPDEDALVALIDDESSAKPDLRAHVAACATCMMGVAELRETRRILLAIAVNQQHPRHDVASHAMTRIRLRATAVSNINEVFAGLCALVRGLKVVLSGPSPRSNVTPTRAGGKGSLHG